MTRNFGIGPHRSMGSNNIALNAVKTTQPRKPSKALEVIAAFIALLLFSLVVFMGLIAIG